MKRLIRLYVDGVTKETKAAFGVKEFPLGPAL